MLHCRRISTCAVLCVVSSDRISACTRPSCSQLDTARSARSTGARCYLSVRGIASNFACSLLTLSSARILRPKGCVLTAQRSGPVRGGAGHSGHQAGLTTGQLQDNYRTTTGQLQDNYRTLQDIYRTTTGHLQDNYRTSTGHLQDNYRTSTGQV